jgi:hypothetical protein
LRAGGGRKHPKVLVNDFKKLRASQEKVDDFEAIPAVRDLKAIRGLRANGTPLIMYPKKYMNTRRGDRR